MILYPVKLIMIFNHHTSVNIAASRQLFLNYFLFPLCIYFTCKYSLQITIGLVQGLWFLLHYWCWALTGTPLLSSYCCPVSCRSLSFGSVEMAPSLTPTDNKRCGRCGGPTHNPGSRLGQSISPLCFTPRVSSPPLTSLVHPVQQWARGGACFRFMPSWLTLPFLDH